MTAPRTIRPVLMGLFAIGVAVFAQFRLQDQNVFDAVLLYVTALIIFLAQFGRGNAAQLPRYRDQRRGIPWLNLAAWNTWVGLALFAGAAFLSWLAWDDFYVNEPEATTAWWLHIAGVLVALAAAYLLDGTHALADWRAGRQSLRAARSSAGNDELSPATVAVWLALIVAIGAFMRFWRFESLPFGIWYDEANSALQAIRILDNNGFRPIFDGATHGPAHFLYLVALSFDLFGVGIRQLRAVTVVMGLAATFAAYLLGRELYEQRAGLILAFVTAVGAWAVTLSRFGMYATLSTPLFSVLAVYFLLHSLRSLRYSSFAWAGFWLGIGLCFYTSYRLFVAAIALFLLYYLIVETIRYRRIPALRLWAGFVLMGLVALAVVMPLVLFAYKHPDIFWSRVQTTFIFADKSPGERWPALWENVRVHLLMFNWRGDPNGRHNLPGAPMVDPVTGALMVLGAGLALWRWRDPVWFLMPIWLGMALLAGILTLDFEAPQSLRANGAMPVAFLLAVAPLYALWRAWRRSDGRYFPNLPAIPLIALLLLPTGILNYRRYFVEQANNFASWAAYSTAETITGHLLAELDPDIDAYVISFFHGHPTLNFLAGYDAPYVRLETTDRLPLPLSSERGALLILDAERNEFYEEAKRLYPHAHFEEHRAPFGGPPVLYTISLSPEDIASIQGLDAVYFFGAEWQGLPVFTERTRNFEIDWTDNRAISPPYSVQWGGILRADEYGLYQFLVQSPGMTDLEIDGVEVLSGAGERFGGLFLAEGNHAIRLRTSVPDSETPAVFRLLWRPPDHGAELVPAAAFYSSPVHSNGLLGRYFANGDWQEPETLARIDPQVDFYFHNPVLPRPYTVEWTGKIAVPQSGRYRFGLMSIDESSLVINGREIAASIEPNQYDEGAVDLESGLHDIQVRFADRTDHTNVTLYWTPPWGERSVVPASLFYPPQGNFAHVTMPSVEQLGAVADAAPLQSPPAGQLPALFETIYSGLQTPRGVAAGDDSRLFVTDSDAQQLLVLDDVGVVHAVVGGAQATAAGSQTFEAPFDVDVGEFGSIFVLDSVAAQLSILDSNGTFVRALGDDPSLFDRARGLFVDGGGRIWIAQTPTGQVIVLDPSGAVERRIPVWPGEDAQPVDVAVAPDGTIYVVDAGLYKLIRYDAQGRRQIAWDLPRFNSLDSSRLAVDNRGIVYITVPEESAVWSFDAAGAQIGTWQVPSDTGVPSRPVGIDIGPDGEIVVTDVANGRVVRILPDG